MPAPPPDPIALDRPRVELHGPARVIVGATVVPLERKQAALIAWLAVHGATPRARLAGLLWPAAGEERARGNLRQSLSKLRQSARDLFAEERALLALAPDVEIAAAPPGTAWLEAFDYADCSDFSAWLEAEREARRNALRRGLLADVRAAAQSGSLDEALRQADALLAVDRESEEAYRALMEVFYLRGDLAAAIAVWDRCREMMRGLYGVLPSAATQRLGQTLTSAEPVAQAIPSAAIPVTVLRPPRLIGRIGVVDRLVAAWRVGDAVCVSGEGGVGKSRVLAEFAAAIGPCAAAAARPGDGVLPYASLSRLVLAAIQRFEPPLAGGAVDRAVRLLPQIAEACGRAEPEPLRTAHERAESQRGVAELLILCVDRGCAAFVFDDLQFADRASVEALQALVEHDEHEGRPADADVAGAAGSSLPARLALGCRGEELGAHAQALLASLASVRRLTQIELAPLGEAEVLELMQSLALPGFDPCLQAPRLRRRVGGNPAYLLESVKLVAALGQLDDTDSAFPVPPGIEAVVARRLTLLSGEARHIAELAAVAGESYSVALASQALARPLAELSEPLRELEWRQVLYGRQFVHDVVADAVRRSVPAAVAEMLHRFVAGALERAAGEPAVVAGHWLACDEPLQAGNAFMAAAAKARAAFRPAELVQMLDAAADAYGRGGDLAARFGALRERLLVSSAPDYMQTRQRQLERLVAEASGEEQRLQAMVETVSWHAEHVRSDTLALAEAGLAQAHALGLDRLAFEFAQPTAWQLASTGDAERALAVIEAQRAWVMAQPELVLRARFHVARSGVLGITDRLGEAIDDSERGLAVLREADEPLQMLPLLANLGLFRSWRGEFGLAHEVLAEARQLRDRLHGAGTTLIIDLHCGAALRDLGRYREALAMLEAAVVAYRSQLVSEGDLLTDLVVGENHIAQLWLALGRPDRAEQALASDDSSTDLRFRVRRATLRLRAKRIAGRNDEEQLDALRRQAEVMPISSARVLAELEVARGESLPAAWARVEALCELAVVGERPGLQMHALALRAALARQQGVHVLARACIDRVLGYAESVLPFDVEAGEVWRIAAAVAAQDGDAMLAAKAADRARAWQLAAEGGGASEP